MKSDSSNSDFNNETCSASILLNIFSRIKTVVHRFFFFESLKKKLFKFNLEANVCLYVRPWKICPKDVQPIREYPFVVHVDTILGVNYFWLNYRLLSFDRKHCFALIWAHQKRINIDTSQWQFKNMFTGQVAGRETF